MMPLLLPLLPQLLGLVGAAVAVGVGVAYIRRSGQQSQQLSDREKTLDQVRERDAADADVAAKSDAAVADELRSKWTR